MPTLQAVENDWLKQRLMLNLRTKGITAMSHFYGVLNGNRGRATRQGTKQSGLKTIAASWKGCITMELYIDEQGRDCFVVRQDTWHSVGIMQEIAKGIIGVSSEEYDSIKKAAQKIIEDQAYSERRIDGLTKHLHKGSKT